MPETPAEHHLTVARTARYWTLGLPGSAHDEVWFVLHGYRQLARRFLRRFASIADDRRLIVAPEGLSRFYVSAEQGRHGPESIVGASWMTREDRECEIRDYVAYLDRLGAETLHGGERVTVLGFSQGAATAIRWVTYGALRPERLVLWAGSVPPDLDLELATSVLAGVDVVIVRGDEDPGLDPEASEREAAPLAAAGVTYRVVRYDGAHGIDSETLRGLTTPQR